MLVRILQLSVLPFLISLGLKLNQRDRNIFQEDPVLDVLNPTESKDGQTITTDQLRTILSAFQRDYVARITKLQNDFELTLKYQENRIHNLEKKSAEQERIISILLNDFFAVGSNQEPLESDMSKKEASMNSSYIPTRKVTVTNEPSTNDEVKDFENKNLESPKPKGHNRYDRKERLLTPGVPAPGAVVAFYAYMSANLPTNVATPHHVLIFDKVRTNIGNGYHPSTGVFIVPETGVYVFIWNFRNGNGGYHSTQLMINSEEWGVTHSHTVSNNWAQSMGSVVAHVNEGDDVFVKTSGISTLGIIFSDDYGKTSFSGWKID